MMKSPTKVFWDYLGGNCYDISVNNVKMRMVLYHRDREKFYVVYDPTRDGFWGIEEYSTSVLFVRHKFMAK